MASKQIAHKDGRVGGYLVGRTHHEGGIRIRNVDSGQDIEAENGEVIVNATAVNSPRLNDFNGERLTNKEVLSRINTRDGNGVSFMEKGGHLTENDTCHCSHKDKYMFNGQEMSGWDIAQEMARGGEVDCGCQHMPKDLKVAHRFLPVHAQNGAYLPEIFNETEQQLINHFRQFPRTYATLYGHTQEDIRSMLEANLVYTTGMMNTGYMDVFLTPEGKKLLFPLRSDTGMRLNGHSAPLILKKGGKVTEELEKPTTFFKGIEARYNNPYEINRAIEELLDSRPDNKQLSSDEKQFCSYYTGYGGLQKFGATGTGLLYEYYTPTPIAQKMWALAYKYGYRGGPVLEPACGIGEFFKFLPNTETPATGFEINPFAARIASFLYPHVKIEKRPFEELFIKGNDTIKGKVDILEKFSLVIGNPPYGNFEGKHSGLGERSYTHATNYVDYFIFRGLDVLQKDGLLIMIIGAEVQAGGIPFLGQQMNQIKKEIASKSRLLDAYRLPNGVFERTDVLTDIIVLQKK